MQYYAKAIYSGLVAFLGSIGTALLAVDDAGFGDLSTGVWVAAGVLGLVAGGGVLGWQAAPASVSTSVK
jgi:hypothetical protein